jgi:hypothetical protein
MTAKAGSNLGSNPLDGLSSVDALISSIEAIPKKNEEKLEKKTPPTPPPAKAQKKTKEKVEEKKKEEKDRLSALLPVDLINEVRWCVCHLQGAPTFLSVSAMMENALKAELLRLRKEHNEGKAFDGTSQMKPKIGRPVKPSR